MPDRLGRQYVRRTYWFRIDTSEAGLGFASTLARPSENAADLTGWSASSISTALPDKLMIQERIVDAAMDVLIKKGLDRWTIDAVAQEAGCAKGLVHYHHGTKARLLTEVAAQLSRRRFQQRKSALERPGAQGLDGLWELLGDDVASGNTAAWASLLGYPLARQATGLAPSEGELRALAETIEKSLALPPLTTTQALALLAALDGFEMALLSRAEPDAVHDAYHRFWLTLISG